MRLIARQISTLRLATAVAALAASLLLMLSSTYAAVVTLKNGDTIHGLIVRMEDRKLEIDPEFSGKNIFIDWEDVQSLTTERAMSIKLYASAEIPENAGIRVRDRIIVHSLEEGGPIRLEDIRSINLAEEDYYGYISLGGNQTSGNTQTQAFNVNGTLTYRAEEHRFILDGRYNRAQADGQDTANNGAFSVKYDHFLKRRLYAGAFNLTESDQFQKLTVRNTSGALMGYDIIDRAGHFLTFAAGPAAVYQDFKTTAATATASGTWVVRYEVRFRGNDVIIFHRQQGFQDVSHGAAFRLNADQGIRISVASRWRLNVEYDLRYNSRPVENKKTLDTNFILGLSYDIKP